GAPGPGSSAGRPAPGEEPSTDPTAVGPDATEQDTGPDDSESGGDRLWTRNLYDRWDTGRGRLRRLVDYLGDLLRP
ncbi:MAG: hypothetical protein ACRDUA_22855, partial [Micromonosporaceae bacterium]